MFAAGQWPSAHIRNRKPVDIAMRMGSSQSAAGTNLNLQGADMFIHYILSKLWKNIAFH